MTSASPSAPTARRHAVAHEISRPEYAARYGPTTGDRVRLGDTDLLALIERDETSYGDELLRGWGKTMRTGMLMSDRVPSASELASSTQATWVSSSSWGPKPARCSTSWW